MLALQRARGGQGGFDEGDFGWGQLEEAIDDLVDLVDLRLMHSQRGVIPTLGSGGAGFG